MKILEYKQCKNNIYEVTFENGEKHKLYDDIILKYELLIEKKVNDKTLKKILEENEKMTAYYIALKYISIRMRSEKEIEVYLKKKNTDNANIDYAIERLKKEKYINPDSYAQAYINDAINLSMYGPKKIEDSLLKLGIENSTIDKYISKIDSEVWQDRIKKILDKKSKINKNSASIFKKKMFSHLTNLGYNISMINELLSNFKIDTSNAFIKEADKTWGLLERKYSSKELILRFKNKMFTKGFSTEEINSFIEKKTDKSF